MQEGFCGETRTHMCLLNQRLLLIEAGGKRAWGGALDLRSFASYQKTFAGTLRRPHTAVFTTSKPRVLHEWTVRAEVTLYDPQKSEFSLTFQSVWWRQKTKGWRRTVLECVGMGWILAVPNVPRREKRPPPLSFCCLNVFLFLIVNIKSNFYCAFSKSCSSCPDPHLSLLHSFIHFFPILSWLKN